MRAGIVIVALAIVAAVTYGILHDLVTAHVCVEYFTIGHAPVFATREPVLLALGWGVIATWWVGLLLGIPLAMSARCGRRPPIAPEALLRPLGRMLVTMAAVALGTGILGFLLAE